MTTSKINTTQTILSQPELGTAQPELVQEYCCYAYIGVVFLSLLKATVVVVIAVVVHVNDVVLNIVADNIKFSIGQ